MIKLLVDHLRTSATLQNTSLPHAKIYRLPNWEIVTSFEAFKKYIVQKKLPDVISIGHELSPAHLSPDIKEAFDKVNTVNARYLEDHLYKKYIPGCGFHVAKYLVDYCIHNGYRMPVCFIHTQDHKAVSNILSALDEYDRRKEIIDRTGMRGSEDEDAMMAMYGHSCDGC